MTLPSSQSGHVSQTDQPVQSTLPMGLNDPQDWSQFRQFWVGQASDLPAIADTIATAPLVALDSEFIRVTTLYPVLGVLQIHVDGHLYLLDGQLDLTPIWQVLCQHECLVMHACGEDLEMLYQYAGCPPLTNVLDTQIALAYLGYGRQLGYQAAVEQILGQILDKEHTRSDWLARPLTDAQLHYAALDVLYLLPMAKYLMQRLRQTGWLSAVLEDSGHYARRQYPLDDVEQSYLDMANFRHTSRQLMQLKRLCAWRERVCRQQNIPRPFLLRNQHIQHLIEKPPTALWQLTQFYDIKSKVVRQYGQTILSLLHELPDQSDWPKRLPRPLPLAVQIRQHLEATQSTLAEQLGVPVDIVMKKRWLGEWLQFSLRYVADQPEFQHLPSDSIWLGYRAALAQNLPELTGWRFDVVIRPMMMQLLLSLADANPAVASKQDQQASTSN